MNNTSYTATPSLAQAEHQEQSALGPLGKGEVFPYHHSDHIVSLRSKVWIHFLCLPSLMDRAH